MPSNINFLIKLHSGLNICYFISTKAFIVNKFERREVWSAGMCSCRFWEIFEFSNIERTFVPSDQLFSCPNRNIQARITGVAWKNKLKKKKKNVDIWFSMETEIEKWHKKVWFLCLMAYQPL